jgi:hypothetical protein
MKETKMSDPSTAKYMILDDTLHNINDHGISREDLYQDGNKKHFWYDCDKKQFHEVQLFDSFEDVQNNIT